MFKDFKGIDEFMNYIVYNRNMFFIFLFIVVFYVKIFLVI